MDATLRQIHFLGFGLGLFVPNEVNLTFWEGLLLDDREIVFPDRTDAVPKEQRTCSALCATGTHYFEPFV